MTINSKRKGKTGELEAAHAIRRPTFDEIVAECRKEEEDADASTPPPTERKPRTWWVNVYSPTTGYAYATKVMADRCCTVARIECTEFREIIRDSNGQELLTSEVQAMIEEITRLTDELARANREIERLRDVILSKQIQRRLLNEMSETGCNCGGHYGCRLAMRMLSEMDKSKDES